VPTTILLVCPKAVEKIRKQNKLSFKKRDNITEYFSEYLPPK
jgi:hypothetical protein